MSESLQHTVYKLEGKVETLERQTENHSMTLSRHSVDIEDIKRDNGKIMQSVNRAEGAYKMLAIIASILGFLITVGILSITFGGG